MLGDQIRYQKIQDRVADQIVSEKHGEDFPAVAADHRFEAPGFEGASTLLQRRFQIGNDSRRLGVGHHGWACNPERYADKLAISFSR